MTPSGHSNDQQYTLMLQDKRIVSEGKAENGIGQRNDSPAFASGRSAMSPLRHRPLSRSSTLGDIRASAERRRSSFMTSESVDRESIKSSMSEILLPRAAAPGQHTQNEPSHLHSAPLVLALLPALGGILFHNGSAVLTDITLLILAGIFLNWSVRLPWDWYYSTQSIRTQPEVPSEVYFTPDDTIIEERSEDEEQEAAKKEAADTTKVGSDSTRQKGSTERAEGSSPQQADAASELRWHEILALLSCFIGPIFGAWLLHTIRFQLSRPSEGLVSDYNLSIFLLAAEARPVSHVLTLIQSRTLYLQRIVATNPHAPQPSETSVPKEVLARLDELESHAALAVTEAKAKAEEPKAPQVVTEVRKSIQPELDALNRAVRRYEKRATVFNLQIETQLRDLESRTKDALSLAAAAERGRKGSASVLMDFLAALVVVPVQTMLTLSSAALTIPKAALENGSRLIQEYLEALWGMIHLSKGKKKGKEKEREVAVKRKVKRNE